jgi:hypothetical protein
MTRPLPIKVDLDGQTITTATTKVAAAGVNLVRGKAVIKVAI